MDVARFLLDRLLDHVVDQLDDRRLGRLRAHVECECLDFVFDHLDLFFLDPKLVQDVLVAALLLVEALDKRLQSFFGHCDRLHRLARERLDKVNGGHIKRVHHPEPNHTAQPAQRHDVQLARDWLRHRLQHVGSDRDRRGVRQHLEPRPVGDNPLRLLLRHGAAQDERLGEPHPLRAHRRERRADLGRTDQAARDERARQRLSGPGRPGRVHEGLLGHLRCGLWAAPAGAIGPMRR